MRFFPPSTIPHPWRAALPYLLALAAFTIALFFLFLAACAVTEMIPADSWSFTKVSA